MHGLKNPGTGEAEASEFKASLIYGRSSRIARETQKPCLENNNNEKQNKTKTLRNNLVLRCMTLNSLWLIEDHCVIVFCCCLNHILLVLSGENSGAFSLKASKVSK